jgi:hypothetical protein
MKASDTIRSALAEVAALRATRAANPRLAHAMEAVQAFQAKRFRTTYADLQNDARFRPAVQFFLTDLYGNQDYTARDAQFGRIATPLERLFPAAVIDTAVAMAQLHATTERLDCAMAQAWLAQQPLADDGLLPPLSALDYTLIWQQVGQRTEREFQLATVLRVGHDLSTMTTKRGLRTLLRMMRGPARASGMGALQHFLERGFDTFGDLSTHDAGAHEFLTHIAEREAALLVSLFAAPPQSASQLLLI